MNIVAIGCLTAVGGHCYFAGEEECSVAERVMCWTVGGMS